MEDQGEINVPDRVFWRLIVQPSGNDVHITKEIHKWKKVVERQNGELLEYWHREKSKTITMDHDKTDGVVIENGQIRFEKKGSYLVIHDVGLAEDIKDWGYTSDDFQLQDPFFVTRDGSIGVREPRPNSPKPIILFGKNVQIETEVDVQENGRVNPVLYCQQPGDSQKVYLGVKSVNHLYQAVWKISEQLYETKPYKLSGMHLLLVGQDKDRESKIDDPTYFEFFVDSIPCKVDLDTQIAPERISGSTVNAHYFSDEPMDWYVGYDPVEKVSFEGTIRRLVFDPNASCPECP